MSRHDDAPHAERRRLIGWCDWCRRGPCRGWVWLYWDVRRQCWRRVPAARRGEYPRLCQRCHKLDLMYSESPWDPFDAAPPYEDALRMGVN